MSDLLKFETSLKRKKPVKDKTDMSSVLKSFKLDFNPLNVFYFFIFYIVGVDVRA